MSDSPPAIRGFKRTFTVIGAIYTLMAVSMLVRGPEFLREFGVSAELVAQPVLSDFFYFFYQLMAFVGVLMILCGHVARERETQVLTAATFCVAHVFFLIRDISTSDSPFGNALYEGRQTLVFVAIGAALVVAFGSVALRGALAGRHRAEQMR